MNRFERLTRRTNDSSLDRFATLIPDQLLDVSGHAFFTGQDGFSGQRTLYLLGLNPGGEHPETVRQQYHDARAGRSDYSAFRVHTWKAESRIDRNVLHLLSNLSLDPGSVPASCVVFARTRTESELRSEFQRLASLCWPFHRAVIDTLGVRVVVCFGGLGADFVRHQLGARQQVDSFVETNNRGWRSTTFVGTGGIKVVQVTHPSRADWRNPAADISPLVRRALAADGGRPGLTPNPEQNPIAGWAR